MVARWAIYATLSTLSVSIVPIFLKIGTKGLDPVLVITLRTIIMSLFLITLSAGILIFTDLDLSFEGVTQRKIVALVISAIAGGSSLIFYTFACRSNAGLSKIYAIDRLSLIIVVVLNMLFLNEKISFQSGLGAGLMVIGAWCISFA